MNEPTIAEWRDSYDRRLRADWGWLTVTGLHWIDEGVHSLGSAADADIQLEAGVPAHVANLIREGTEVRLEVLESGVITRGSGPAESGPLSFSGTQGERYQLGTQSFLVVRRGERVGVRTWDNNSRQRRDFTGPDWYPANPDFVVEAVFSPWGESRQVHYLNAIGDEKQIQATGEWRFSLNGVENSLISFSAPDAEQFFVFRDGTSGQTSYGAGRFLQTAKPQQGRITIDFNRSYNPPCAFTPHATCPLAPRENVLDVVVDAGERDYRS